MNGSDRGLISRATPEFSCSDGGKERETRLGARPTFKPGEIPNTSRNHHLRAALLQIILRY